MRTNKAFVPNWQTVAINGLPAKAEVLQVDGKTYYWLKAIFHGESERRLYRDNKGGTQTLLEGNAKAKVLAGKEQRVR